MKQHGREKELALIWELKQSLAGVKQQSRLAQGQHFPARQWLCTSTHIFTHTYTPSYKDSPSWPGSSVSLQWEMGNIFPGGVLLLSIWKIVFLPPGGRSDGVSITPAPPVSFWMFLFSSFPILLSTSMCYILSSLIIFFSWFLIRILSLPLFVSVFIPLFVSLFFLWPSPTNSSVQ